MTGSAALDPEMTETHLSVVIALGARVYKLKKPVKFDFVDQSTVEARRHLCDLEVRRNRRLSPDVYEGVATVVDADGTTLEPLVVMRRMPADRRLSTLVCKGDVDVIPGLTHLAALLAEFHQRADRSPVIDTAGTSESQLSLWEANADQMMPFNGTVFPAGMVGATARLARTFILGRDQLFADRVQQHLICDGHGDLLADDIFLLPDGPRVLDCVEFDERLCHGDVAADVAFLAMDLERLGCPALATRWITEYERAADQSLPPPLMHLYIAYRAQIRAKVVALRSIQSGEHEHAEQARRLLRICHRHLRLATVRLVLVGGAPGTGKSTIARMLGHRHGWTVLRSDTIRRQLFEHTSQPVDEVPYEEGIYTAAHTIATYEHLFRQAEQQLGRGHTVVLDASFATAAMRQQARELAVDAGAELLELRADLDPVEAARRVRLRRARQHDDSEASAMIATRMAAEAEPWPEAVTLSTAGSQDAVAVLLSAIVDRVLLVDDPAT